MTYFLFFLLSFNALAWNLPDSFESVRLQAEEITLDNSIKLKFQIAQGSLSSKAIESILSDSQNKVHDDFKITDYFKSSVAFWFSIYTQYSTKQIVVHDKEDLSIIYKALDFTELHNSKINRFAKEKLQVRLSLNHAKEIKKILKKLASKWVKFSPDEQSVLDAIKVSGKKIPRYRSSRKKFFLKLSRNVRIQTGQRDMIHKGLLRSFAYDNFFKKHLKLFNLPKELLAIPFLESSFNRDATSRVNAAGMWQFMPYIGNLMMPKTTDNVDYRYNPVVSTIAAFHLLKENKMILKSWDLAITAYNSGTKHLIRARRKFKNRTKNINLSYVLKNYKHAHLGFASKNFYSEFLALAYILAYKNKVFPVEGFQDKTTPFNGDIKLYLTKCRLTPSWYLNIIKKSSPNIFALNNHFKVKKKKLDKGVILVSDINLNPKRYFQITETETRKLRPKKWPSLVKNKSCR